MWKASAIVVKIFYRIKFTDELYKSDFVYVLFIT